MIVLITGVTLWAASHLMKRLTPGLRAQMDARLGDHGAKGVVSILSFLAIFLMITGYRAADVVILWTPPAFMTHLNNLLMVAAVILVNLGYSRGVLRTKLRHPMLASVKVWALAHLLVNGDLASVVLFGGILAWAVLDMILINKQTPAWIPPRAGPIKNDVIYLAASALVFGVITYIHTSLGYSPFG